MNKLYLYRIKAASFGEALVLSTDPASAFLTLYERMKRDIKEGDEEAVWERMGTISIELVAKQDNIIVSPSTFLIDSPGVIQIVEKWKEEQ